MNKKENQKASLLGGRLVGGIKRISVSLFLGANLCTILLLWLCVGLTFVSPDIMPRMSLLTLLFPVFLGVDLLFVVFWLLFQARLVWVPIVGALVVGGYVLDYCPMNFSSNSDEDSTLTIISYNVGYSKTEEEREELSRLICASSADIVCLQEINTGFIRKYRNRLDSASFIVRQSGSIATLSRLPVLSDTIHIEYTTRHNRSMACWIDCFGDSLLIVNNHLESNGLSPEEKDEYTNALIEPKSEAIKSSSRVLIGKLSEAAAYRGAQADTIRAIAEHNAGHSLIVCGDFNDTPISYTYQRLARCLTSAYRQAGRGPGFTYTRRSFPVRIDHLFYSKDWTCTSCKIDRTVSTSDHYPLIVRLSKNVR